jgi:hypothetical protein
MGQAISPMFSWPKYRHFWHENQGDPQWGPCLCKATEPDTCPSCATAKRIEDAGLDWDTEYDNAIQAGEAIVL